MAAIFVGFVQTTGKCVRACVPALGSKVGLPYSHHKNGERFRCTLHKKEGILNKVKKEKYKLHNFIMSHSSTFLRHELFKLL
jgi:hypothetical protein